MLRLPSTPSPLHRMHEQTIARRASSGSCVASNTCLSADKSETRKGDRESGDRKACKAPADARQQQPADTRVMIFMTMFTAKNRLLRSTQLQASVRRARSLRARPESRCTDQSHCLSLSRSHMPRHSCAEYSLDSALASPFMIALVAWDE